MYALDDLTMKYRKNRNFPLNSKANRIIDIKTRFFIKLQNSNLCSNMDLNSVKNH